MNTITFTDGFEDFIEVISSITHFSDRPCAATTYDISLYSEYKDEDQEPEMRPCIVWKEKQVVKVVYFFTVQKLLVFDCPEGVDKIFYTGLATTYNLDIVHF